MVSAIGSGEFVQNKQVENLDVCGEGITLSGMTVNGDLTILAGSKRVSVVASIVRGRLIEMNDPKENSIKHNSIVGGRWIVKDGVLKRR